MNGIKMLLAAAPWLEDVRFWLFESRTSALILGWLLGVWFMLGWGRGVSNALNRTHGTSDSLSVGSRPAKQSQRGTKNRLGDGTARSGLMVPRVLALFLFLLATPALARDAVWTWTAPGDDGMVGRAYMYEMRYKTVTVAGTDTAGWWNNAAVVPGLPVPGVPGTRDSVVVTGLDPARSYHAIIVTVDEVRLRSYYSNIAVLSPLPVLDIIRPAAIRDNGVRPR